MSPMTMNLWMPCFLSCRSKSVLAKPLEHQCSSATIFARLRRELGTDLATPCPVFESLVRPRCLLDRRNVLPGLVVARAISMMQRIEDAKPRRPRRIEDLDHMSNILVRFSNTLQAIP